MADSKVPLEAAASRAHWVKQNQDVRRMHLITADCDSRLVLSLSSDQLVEKCLVLDGYGDGELVKNRPVVQAVNSSAALLMFMEKMQRESEEREAARVREAAEREARLQERLEQ